jgi:hypothetical protein
MTFTVFSVYYKHGEFIVETLEDEYTLRKFLAQYLNEHNHVLDMFLPLENLCEEVVNLGHKVIAEQAGFGIVAIVRGDVVAS